MERGYCKDCNNSDYSSDDDKKFKVKKVKEVGQDIEKYHPYLNFYDQKRNISNVYTINQFARNMHDYHKDVLPMYRPIEMYELHRTLFEALLFPEMAKGIKLPAPFQIPTYCFQQKNSFILQTNSSGCAFVQVNLGQILDNNMYFTDPVTTPLTKNSTFTGTSLTLDSTTLTQLGLNLLGSGAINVGTSATYALGLNQPLSTVFCTNPNLTAIPKLNGITALDQTSTSRTSSATNNAADIIPLDVCRLPATTSSMFNAYRAGPISVKYEYIGRLDISSGSVTMGVNYSSPTSSTVGTVGACLWNSTTKVDPTASSTVIGNAVKNISSLVFDPTYTSLTAIEDCPYARTVPVTDTLKGVYIPQDYSSLNMKSTTDGANASIPQRLHLLVQGAPVSQNIARITITQNWEATPAPGFADVLSLSYNTFPSDFDGKAIYEYIVSNNLVISKDEKEFGLYKFAEQFKMY